MKVNKEKSMKKITKTNKKTVGTLVIVGALVSSTLMGTLAWLSAKSELTNIFVVGQIDKIDEMDGRTFELFTGDLLFKNGFENITVTQASYDFGVDVIAEKDDIKYAIQCKRYNGPIGVSAVQEVIASKSLQDCHVACVLTNSSFTPAAVELAKKNLVILWERKKLQKFIDNAKG